MRFLSWILVLYIDSMFIQLSGYFSRQCVLNINKLTYWLTTYTTWTRPCVWYRVYPVLQKETVSERRHMCRRWLA